MKKLFTFLFLLFTAAAFGQQYNNEWIDFSKVYYKFKVGQTGLYRISQVTLNAAGIGSTPAEQFKLIRNGVEVPIYTTAATGPLASDGYIEFWGEMNDGKPDLPLYRDPAFQHSDKLSLQTDTAVYFLTINAGSNLRLTDQLNDVASTVLPAEDFFMYTAGNHFRTKINPGYARNAGEYVYSSSYDQGEYFSSADIPPAVPLSDQINNMFIYTGGPDAYIKFGASGNAMNYRTLNVKVNGTLIIDSSIESFDDLLVPQWNVPITSINGSAALVTFTNTSLVSTDRIVVSFYDLTYPRKFNFGGASNFPFTLPAKGNGYYLAITNFNNGTALPVLYDLTNHQRYTAVLGGGDTLKFALPGTTQASQLVLVNQDASNVINVTTLSSKTFTDFTNTSNQGDYLIISNSILYTGSTGNNPVIDYRDYRRSIDGGGYNATVVDIDELVDQFAFGIKKHPLSIKNFLRFARDRFTVSPKFVFLMGRGVDYQNYRAHQSDPLADRINMIPCFGYPGSDNMLSSSSAISGVPVTPIGRLSVIRGQEIEDYLQKMKEYEHAQQSAPNTLSDRLWMKSILHVTGASQSELGLTLCNYMHGYKDMIDDTLTGTNVHMFCKASADPTEQLSGEDVARLFNDGLSMVTYFGHSSATTLEFNIDNPEKYQNQGKYPVFSVNGCNAGNFFTFYPQRLEVNETLSEKFVLAKERGGIAFLASTHFGIVNYLNIYINSLYKNITNFQYDSSLGEITKKALNQLIVVAGDNDFFARTHSEQMTLHGDPALKLNFQVKPDYVLEDPQVKISPSFISIAENQFQLSVKMFNLGKAINDSITLEVKRQYPSGSIETIYRQKISGILYSDSLNINVPVIGTRDKGVNKLIITIDADNTTSEMDELNNTITKEFFVYEDEVRPAFPYDFSIVNNAAQKLFASTANPSSPVRDYVMEIDTTELFNSPLKKSSQVTSAAGVMEFDPQIAFTDSTVYYWRVSTVPAPGGDYHWNNFSFVYLENEQPGFNQSHFFQHLKSVTDNITISEPDRKWKFGEQIHNILVRNGVFPTAAGQAEDFSVSIDGNLPILSVCGISNIIINVIDPFTLQPWLNALSGPGQYGSDPVCGINRKYNFQYNILDKDKRKSAMDLLDLIPQGSYVVFRNTSGTDPLTNTYASDWLGDTTYFGSGNSLYQRLFAEGFTNIDSFNRPRAFIFLYKKGAAGGFTPKSIFSSGINDKIETDANVTVPDTLGTILSPLFGPAKEWKQVHWKGTSEETNSADKVSVDVIGADSTDNETTLFTLDNTMMDFDISSINAEQYPYIRLKMHNQDSVTRTPFQLNYWRLNYVPIPEGALAPNLFFTTKDSLDIGEKLNFGIAFKNISQPAFDSIRVKASIIDKDNVTHIISASAKQKPLLSGDTLTARYQIDTKDYPGNNTLLVDFNPDNDQPEQYHYNNFIYRDFYVKPDNINPLLDVTFDGVHILNNDIVSSRPHIQIKVKDEAKYMLLNDTSVISELNLRYPDQNNTEKTYKFDNDTLRFIPAQTGTDNTATIDFSPIFPTILDQAGKPLNPDGDNYELTIKVKDRSGNSTGLTDYKVDFMVIDKPMISNLLNYPNPFTTSTAFVFTITGSEIPQNMKIQILTVTGKIVREITKEELGPLHIGRNITEFKWNGNDQYGQRLANGVYLYRFITGLNGGHSMDKYKAGGDDTDKYFKGGYGKMYLMR